MCFKTFFHLHFPEMCQPEIPPLQISGKEKLISMLKKHQEDISTTIKIMQQEQPGCLAESIDTLSKIHPSCLNLALELDQDDFVLEIQKKFPISVIHF